LADLGYELKIGFEIEFTLLRRDNGKTLDSTNFGSLYTLAEMSDEFLELYE
jgi:hypothetical protein